MSRPDEKPDVPEVSDHALLRYCERVLGVDLDVVRKTILNAGTLAVIRKFPTVRLKHPAGFVMVVKDRKVITLFTGREGQEK